ncbi:MAG: uracil-DNA glycosylase [Gammaproteobacteria bacterium]|nr:uracil-DNA glycosylase [Gammaproteobacteria bacterium]
MTTSKRSISARIPKAWYVSDCSDCTRLVRHLRQTHQEYPYYHCAPVPPFGDLKAKLLVVGLAPGKHGANASGRPFTGDHAGILLYQTLYRYGFADAAESVSVTDGLRLLNCRLTNAVKCLPPENKPIGAEVRSCNHYLAAELKAVAAGGVVLALGTVAHRAIVRALELRLADYPFAHGEIHALPGKRHLVDSYHCSRYNTQTGRLTTQMFQAVFATAKKLLG